MNIQIILGATRPGRIGERVARWVEANARQVEGATFELVDLADYDLPHFNEAISPRFNPNRKPEPEVARLLAKLASADGYVIVTPEYNHAIPGILKDAIDFVDTQFTKKPFAIVSYGSVGGARSAEMLKGIIIESKGAIVPEAVALMSPQSTFAEDGTYLGDTSAAYGPHVAIMTTLHELMWWTKTLRAGRQ